MQKLIKAGESGKRGFYAESVEVHFSAGTRGGIMASFTVDDERLELRV